MKYNVWFALHITLELYHLSPLNGTAGETAFNFECNKWVTDDPPLSYVFQYDLLDIDKMQSESSTILNPTTLFQPFLTNTKLPAGRKNDFIMNIKIRIINRFGTYALYDKQNITVRFVFFFFSSRKSDAVSVKSFRNLYDVLTVR